MTKNFKNERVTYKYEPGTREDEKEVQGIDTIIFYANNNIYAYSQKKSVIQEQGWKLTLKKAKTWLEKKIKKNVVLKELETDV